jgi:para-aminobenzoate synthetase / 4-amino-4-deoxychorismate lyase
MTSELNAETDFQLFETMLVTRNQQVRHAELHLARLQRSAAALDFRFDADQVHRELDAGVTRTIPDIASRLRLTLFREGRVEISSAPLLPLPDGRVDLLIEPNPLSAPRPLSAHKTTFRDEYDQGTRRAEARGAFDALFFTTDGRLVEGGRSNVFVQIDGRWWTPPLSDGALPGVMRALLLEDSAWGAAERTVRLADLRRARSLMVCNALRGAVPGRIVIDP